MLVKRTGGKPFLSLGSQLSGRLDASLQTHYPKYFKKGERKGVRNIYLELVENEKYWSDLLYVVCGGEPSEIDRLTRFDVFEFFAFLTNYERRAEDQKKRIEEQKRKRK